MKKIVCFAGSNSSQSINQTLINFAASQIATHKIEIIRLKDFELPVFSEDIERETGYSPALRLLHSKIRDADALIISVNEHNGMISAFFKNILDWLSRLDISFLSGKKLLLMSTSNGKRGAASALEYTSRLLPKFGGIVTESFSFPAFSHNFSKETQSISNEILSLGFTDVIQNFVHQIEK
ncbi:NAD(P)H-dependent oxidoreductase [Aequorivita sp. SDUM287046]|uniref:NAD(P)H-dependent oxidoreductase n=1 Tax=Aequorivita aurantiaca TaxID=3053356 RepID=A0ABT8DM09_9FLAO|nr:NAD(P)H-dependent oxidoreductase [Aequorivita aurantiaca]MDN3724072.1 NAD(P)H-dependent oxidoreductase [Aequorivita aurantiaca]